MGGGQYPQPREISLPHNGVLFLDELSELKHAVLEVVQQLLEVELRSGDSLWRVARMRGCSLGIAQKVKK